VQSGCYKIRQLAKSDLDRTETFAQVFKRPWEQLRPHLISAWNFNSSWNCHTRSVGNLMPYSHCSNSWRSTTTRYFVLGIHLIYIHMNCFIIICHVLSMTLYMNTFWDTGITEKDSATGSIYFENYCEDRHHLTIRNTHSIFPSSCSSAFLPSFHKSTRFVLFIMVKKALIYSGHQLTLLKPELLLLTNSFQMPWVVRLGVDVGMSSF